jgi:hypothetical protein
LQPQDIRGALKSLPEALDETYKRILLGIDIKHYPKVIAALQWITYSRRPIQVGELAEAVVIDPTADIPFNPAERLCEPDWLVQILSSLVAISNQSRKGRHRRLEEVKEVKEVRLAHFSVKE